MLKLHSHLSSTIAAPVYRIKRHTPWSTFLSIAWQSHQPLMWSVKTHDFRTGAVMDTDLLVIGHSFVKQLQVSLLRRGCTTQIVGADLGVSAQFSSVFYHGVGGLKVDGLLAELPLICELGPRAVIVDIGTNDLSLAGVEPSRLASRTVALAQRVLAVASVSGAGGTHRVLILTTLGLSLIVRWMP